MQIDGVGNAMIYSKQCSVGVVIGLAKRRWSAERPVPHAVMRGRGIDR